MTAAIKPPLSLFLLPTTTYHIMLMHKRNDRESNSPQTRFGFNATKLKTYYISDSELLASYTNRMWLNKIEPPA